MKYCLLMTILIGIVSLMGISIWQNKEDNGVIILRAADAHHHDFPTVRAVAFMADEIEKHSGGRIKIKMFAGGQLGAEKDTILANRIRAIDINRVNLSLYNNLEPKTAIPSLPFIFRSEDHMHRVMDGEIGSEIMASLRQHGLVGLAYYDSGARSFYNTRKPITCPEDMAGLKIRVQDTDVSVCMMKALGACPTPMGFGEVYEALMTGVIDGAENNLPSYKSTRHYEVAKHYSLDQHTMTPEILTISAEVWDALTDEDRAMVRDAAQKSMRMMRQLWEEEVEQARGAVQCAGSQVIEEFDKIPFIKAMGPVYERFASTPELRKLKERIQEVH